MILFDFIRFSVSSFCFSYFSY